MNKKSFVIKKIRIKEARHIQPKERREEKGAVQCRIKSRFLFFISKGQFFKYYETHGTPHLCQHFFQTWLWILLEHLKK
jgi:hypothetical protein